MGVVLLMYLVIYLGVGWLVVMGLVNIRQRPAWFALGFVFWALLPQFYWGAYTLRDYLAFRDECRKLQDQVYLQILDFGVPVIQAADGIPSWQEWISGVNEAVYTDGWPYGRTLQEWRESPKTACPDIRGEDLYQAFRSAQGCYRRTAVDQIDAKYKIVMQRSYPLPGHLSSYTNAHRYDYAVHNLSAEGKPIASEWTQINLTKEVPWNFLLVPWRSEVATCTSNGIDRTQWLEILVNGEQS